MLRNLSLRYRLILAVMPLIAVFMAFTYFKIITHEQEVLTDESRKRAEAIARVLAASSAQAISSLNTHDLELAVDQVKSLTDILDISIVNKNGGIEASPELDKVGRATTDPLVAQVLRGGPQQQPTISPDEKKGTIEGVAPIVINGRVEGAVSLTLSTTTLKDAIAKSTQYVLLLTGLLVIGAVVFMIAIADWFTGPIVRLVDVVRALGAGDLERRAEVRSGDEIAVLGQSFNEMASRLRDTIERERQSNDGTQRHVRELAEHAERVTSGDLDIADSPESPDDTGRLAAAFNDMVRKLRQHTRIQQATLYELEKSNRALAEANRQVIELDRLKSDFLNTVSHELRSPLTSIKAFSEILTDNPNEDPHTVHEFLGIINQESDRLSRLINNLLDLSRIEAGRVQWEMVSVDVRQVVEDSCALVRHQANRRGLVVQVDVADRLRVVGDKDKLTQALTNLLSNAIKFSQSGGSVRLSASRRDDNVEIHVEDDGIGIAPEHHKLIFENFHQVDASTPREVKGSGLGLSIVRGIVEAHGGTVRVGSRPGRGSTFIITLPAPEIDEGFVPTETSAPATVTVQATGAQQHPPVYTDVHTDPGSRTKVHAGKSENGPERARTILVVDDEMNIIRVIRHILEGEGFQVLEAQSGEEALKRAREGRPDLILLDVLLPDIDGFEVLKRLRSDRHLEGIPVVILSILEAKEESFRLGAQDYCNKPIDRAKLLETVQGLLGEPGAETRVLVVDDDPHILHAIMQILGGRGYRVSAARDGLEALVRARDELPHLIVLDLYMPEMDGFEVIRRLRAWEATSNIPILVLTASDVALDEARAIRLGAARYMSKPFTEEELSRVVHEALSRAQLKDSTMPRELGSNTEV